jgi:hypothetical protein
LRELLNIFQAEQVGYHMIFAAADILNTFCRFGKAEQSRGTVRMFRDGALRVGYSL